MPLFGKDKSNVVKGALDLVSGVRGMIDDSKFTDEERARMNMKLADSVADYASSTLSENTERSKARRLISLVSVYFFYFLIVALLVLWKFDPAWYAAALDLIIGFKLPVAFIMIMAFFFGGYYANKFIGTKPVAK